MTVQDVEGVLRRIDLEDDDRLDRSIEAGDFDDPAAFVREATLRLIDDVLDDDGELECPYDDCDRTFATIRKRRGHLGSSEHGLNVPDGEFWCGYCGYGPTSWRGINGHHGKLHDGDPVRLDHEPDRDELLAPEDIPDHMNPELLERLYQEHGGNYTEMCRQHDFTVGAGRVRHYLIEFGIHEVTPNGETEDSDGPVWRDREWLKERYEAADGNISEMHRNLDEDIPYRTLVNNIKRFDFHDHTDPPGQSHGKGGPEAATIDERDDVDEKEQPEPSEAEDHDEWRAEWVLDAEPVVQMGIPYEYLDTPDWQGEGAFYRALDMADDMQDLSEMLGWDEDVDASLEEIVEALPDVDVPGEVSE